jgi:GxxExxY protein
MMKAGLEIKSQVNVPVEYDQVKLELGFRMDVLVENQVIIEIKSVEVLHDVHKKQLLTYLRLSKKKLGILVNFNVSKLVDKESIIRIIN